MSQSAEGATAPGIGRREMAVQGDDIRQAARELGLAGRPLCVHASLRSFGGVKGGARAVVDALLAERCTILVPTFSWGFAVRPPPHLRPERNGTDYDLSSMSNSGNDRVFRPETTEIDRWDMGSIPAAVLNMEGHIRGNHPLNSFTAIGPQSDQLIDGQHALDVYRPLEVLVELGGQIVLMGVDLTRMTLLHLAEKEAGRTLFRRWANGPDGQPMMVEVGSCSDGFEKFDPIVAPLERRVKVGHSQWRVFPGRGTLSAAAQAIRLNASITTCSDPSCQRCAHALLGGPILNAS